MNPGGRVPVSVPRDVWTLLSYYHYKATARWRVYADTPWKLLYSFGYGLSYTSFEFGEYRAWGSSSESDTFTSWDTITFSIGIQNTRQRERSCVLQVYLLGRVSSGTTSAKQLVAFQRVYFDAGQKRRARMGLEVERLFTCVG